MAILTLLVISDYKTTIILLIRAKGPGSGKIEGGIPNQESSVILMIPGKMLKRKVDPQN